LRNKLDVFFMQNQDQLYKIWDTFKVEALMSWEQFLQEQYRQSKTAVKGDVCGCPLCEALTVKGELYE
jgi:hypothetical protein